MSWLLAFMFFWIGSSVGFILGAWWALAHTRAREMGQPEGETEEDDGECAKPAD